MHGTLLRQTRRDLAAYTRFRSALVARLELSNVDAGAVVLRTADVPVAVGAFLTAREAACARGTGGFLVEAAVPVVAFRPPSPVLVGLATVVPEDVVDEKLFLRSP